VAVTPVGASETNITLHIRIGYPPFRAGSINQSSVAVLAIAAEVLLVIDQLVKVDRVFSSAADFERA
jgi:hypothetical protein